MRTKWLIQGIVGSPTSPFEVVHGKVIFQLSHFWLHFLRVRFPFMMRQWFLSQDELVQLVRDIEISALMLE
jgi:hypothetical protein